MSGPIFKMWMTWSELVRSPRITKEEFQTQLRKYKKSAILIACAKLSVAFKYGPDAHNVADEESTRLHIPIVLSPRLWTQMNYWRLVKARIPFFNGQLRLLAAETIRLNTEGCSPTEPQGPQNHEFGELMLKAGELLYKKHVVVMDELDGFANIAAEFLPNYEIASPTDALFAFLRFYIWLTKIIPRIDPKLLKFDLENEFGKVLPFPIITYAEFISAFAMHALHERYNLTYDKPIDGALRKSWLKNADVNPTMIDEMFKSVSFSLDDMPEPKDTLGYSDFEFLKDRPYLLFEEGLFMLDYEYALGKLESAVVWRVLRALPNKKKDPWLSYWGIIFEEYVTWMFQTYAEPRLNHLVPDPVYLASTDQICDQVIICGDTAVLIEVKLATCTAEDRNSADYLKIRAYLEDKLVRTKGVSQLLAAVERIGARGNDVPGYLQGVKKIVPVILTKDDAGGSYGVNAYLNKRFKDQLDPASHDGIAVTSLVCLNISCLERMMWVLKEKSFADAMQERIENDPSLRQPFDAAYPTARRGTPYRLDRHVEAYKELSEKLISDFNMKDESIPTAPVGLSI